jgi:hypothetical protein
MKMVSKSQKKSRQIDSVKETEFPTLSPNISAVTMVTVRLVYANFENNAVLLLPLL